MALFSNKSNEESLAMAARDLIHRINALENMIIRLTKLQRKCEKKPALGDPKQYAADIVKATEQKVYLEQQLLQIDVGIVNAERKRIGKVYKDA